MKYIWLVLGTYLASSSVCHADTKKEQQEFARLKLGISATVFGIAAGQTLIGGGRAYYLNQGLGKIGKSTGENVVRYAFKYSPKSFKKQGILSFEQANQIMSTGSRAERQVLAETLLNVPSKLRSRIVVNGALGVGSLFALLPTALSFASAVHEMKSLANVSTNLQKPRLALSLHKIQKSPNLSVGGSAS